MKAKIKEVQQYFIDKIKANEFEVIRIDEYTIIIEIEKKYRFEFWHTNGRSSFEQYLPDSGKNFIGLELSVTDKQALHSIFVGIVKTYKKDVLRKEKLAQLKKLQEELGIEKEEE